LACKTFLEPEFAERELAKHSSFVLNSYTDSSNSRKRMSRNAEEIQMCREWTSLATHVIIHDMRQHRVIRHGRTQGMQVLKIMPTSN
jgi:hypothetical protein